MSPRLSSSKVHHDLLSGTRELESIWTRGAVLSFRTRSFCFTHGGQPRFQVARLRSMG